MKPFDLQAALTGARLCTRSGCKARLIICWSHKENPVFAVFRDKNTWLHYAHYQEDGRYSTDGESDLDLMMQTNEVGGYIYEKETI